MTSTHVDEPAGVPEQSGPSGLVRLRLDLAYDGTGFHGWARQPGQRSVQAEVEAALRAVLRVPAQVPVRVAVAGRTDSGVHATGQVCHADVPRAAWTAQWRGRPGSSGPGGEGQAAPAAPPDDADLANPTGADPANPDAADPANADAADDPGLLGSLVRRRLNGLLAHDVRVAYVSVAPPGFDARWSASWRRYAYLVADDPRDQDPRTRGHVLWHPRPLDAGAMDAAARPFLGEHDFAAFCRAREGASTVRTVHDISWVRRPAGAPGGVAFAIRADAFCHSMVRSLVGAFLAVGEGRWPVGRPAQLLAAAERVPAIATAPAHGLTLVEVGYPPEADLADQAARAKRWRGR